MAIRSLLSCHNLPFEKTVTGYSAVAVVDGARPPPANDMLPLLRSALFVPLVQPLREVNRTSDLKMDVVWVRLVYNSTVVSSAVRNTWFELTSDLEGINVSRYICSGGSLCHFRSQCRLSIGMQIAGYPIWKSRSESSNKRNVDVSHKCAPSNLMKSSRSFPLR